MTGNSVQIIVPPGGRRFMIGCFQEFLSSKWKIERKFWTGDDVELSDDVSESHDLDWSMWGLSLSKEG